MRVARVYTPQKLAPNARVVLEPAASHHVTAVLRARPGASLVLFDGDDRAIDARIKSADHRKGVIAVTAGEFLPPTAVVLETILGLAITRPNAMAEAIQKATELGVTCIQPLLTERAQARLVPPRLLSRWRQITIASCEQCGRNRLPELPEPQEFDEWLRNPGSPNRLLLSTRTREPLAAVPPPTGSIAVAVGPEGGFSAAEERDALARGFIAVSLGPRVLRAETAPVAGLAIIQSLWGDLGLAPLPESAG